MKTLIATTGTRNWLMNNYLPSLKERGKYSGDILLLEYEKIPSYMKLKDQVKDVDAKDLGKRYNVIFKKVQYQYECLCSDRIRAFYEVLKEDDLWKDYDVIMITDGNDIEYFKPIQPLFDMAKSKLCYVVEREEHVGIGWIKYEGYPDANKVWKVTSTKPIINAGMIVGPALEIMKTLGFITKMMKYNASFGADQLLLNALVYYYKYPSQRLGYEWNYCLACGIIRVVSIRGNEVITQDDLTGKVAILHKNAMQHGVIHRDLEEWKKMVFPACQMPNEGWMNRRGREDL